MNKRNFLIPVVLMALLLAACSQAGKTGLLVPKDAALVVHVNMKSLSGKMTWEDIRNADWFKSMSDQTVPNDSTAQKLLNDPATSGINLKEDMVFHLARHNGSGYFAFQGKLTDAAAFENTLNSSRSEKITINSDGDLKFTNPDEMTLLLWNKDRFMMLANAPLDEMGGNYGNGRSRMLKGDTLMQLGKDILALKGDKLLDSDKRFASLIGETGDLHFWTNAEFFADARMGMLTSMLKVSTLIEGNISAGTLHFDNGKITFDNIQYVSKDLASLLKKHTPKTVGTDLIKRLPSGEVMAAGVFNYPPEGLKELSKLIGADGMVNGFFGEFNYSMDEFVAANKGDIAFALADFGVKKDSVEYEGFNGKKEFYVRENPDLNFVAAVSVNDKEAFGKLVGIVQQQVKNADQATRDLQYSFDENWLVFGSSQGEIDRFKAGNNSPAYADKISGHQMGFFVDVNRILGRVKAIMNQDNPAAEQSSTGSILNASIAFWDNAILYGDVEDGKVKTHMEVNLIDRNSNSLKQLTNYLGGIANQFTKSMSAPAEWPADSVSVEAVPSK